MEISELERREIVEAIDSLLAAVEGEIEVEGLLYNELDRLRNVKKILGAHDDNL